MMDGRGFYEVKTKCRPLKRAQANSMWASGCSVRVHNSGPVYVRVINNGEAWRCCIMRVDKSWARRLL